MTDKVPPDAFFLYARSRIGKARKSVEGYVRYYCGTFLDWEQILYVHS